MTPDGTVVVDAELGTPPPCPPQLVEVVRSVEWGLKPGEWATLPPDRLAEWLTLWPLWQARQAELQTAVSADDPNTVYLPVYP